MKWLFLCAHPDDLEFFTGHLMIALSKTNVVPQLTQPFLGKDTNHQVVVAAMTRGESSDFTNTVKSTRTAAMVRTHELTNSCAILGLNKPIFLGFFDGFVRVTENAVQKLMYFIEAEQPDILVAPEPTFTFYPHPDHTRTGKIVYYAVMRLIQRNKTGKAQICKIPSVYYFGAYLNHFYFPKFAQFEPIIQQALHAHVSQQNLLIVAQIPGIIGARSNGRRIPQYGKAEALRKQYFPGHHSSSKLSRFRPPISIIQRILHTFSRMVITVDDYDRRLKNYDGTLKPDF